MSDGPRTRSDERPTQGGPGDLTSDPGAREEPEIEDAFDRFRGLSTEDLLITAMHWD